MGKAADLLQVGGFFYCWVMGFYGCGVLRLWGYTVMGLWGFTVMMELHVCKIRIAKFCSTVS